MQMKGTEREYLPNGIVHAQRPLWGVGGGVRFFINTSKDTR
jgi:hypothetical protein